MSIVVPVGECVATLVWQSDQAAKPATVSIGCRPADGPGEMSPVQMLLSLVDNATAGGGWCKSDWMANTWRFLGGSISLMTEEGPIVSEYNTLEIGTGSPSSVAQNTALLVTKRTALGGRRNRGRWYLPPFQAGFNVDDGGLILSNVAGSLGEQLNTWAGLCKLDGVDLLVHHSDGAAGTPITVFQASNIIGTQRRRIR